jgi:hypothetical protein
LIPGPPDDIHFAYAYGRHIVLPVAALGDSAGPVAARLSGGRS